MKKPTFKNRANEEVKLQDGRTVWLSRSPAIVGVILAMDNDDVYLLAEKRSAMMDEPNKWALVSGYLDWDENGYDGIVRETFEETSFYIPFFKDQLIFDNDRQPFYAHTDPHTDAKQNVSLTYIFIYEMDEIPWHVQEFSDPEIDQVKWLKVNTEVFDVGKDWAFHHDERIAMAIDKYNEYML